MQRQMESRICTASASARTGEMALRASGIGRNVARQRWCWAMGRRTSMLWLLRQKAECNVSMG